MNGDKTAIKHLNTQLTNELSAINQYFLHARMCKHWGLHGIAKREYEESTGEMKHADKLIERVLMLGGLPNVQDMHKLLIGESVPEMLQADLTLETGAQATVKDGIAYCETARDYVSRDILQAILDDTEEHIDWIATQLELIGKVGLENYLQSQMASASRRTCSKGQSQRGRQAAQIPYNASEWSASAKPRSLAISSCRRSISGSTNSSTLPQRVHSR